LEGLKNTSICRDDLTHTILGYNTIKHLVKNYPHKQISSVVRKMLPQLSEGDADSFVNIIEESSKQSDVLGDVKTCETIRIPGNCMVKVKGRTRVNIDTGGEKEILFQPLIEFEGENDLIVYESMDVLKWGKSHNINVGVYNPTSEEIVLRKGTILGSVFDISMAINLPSSSLEDIAQVNSVEVETPEEPEAWFDQVDLKHLDEEKRDAMKKTLLNLSDGFSKRKNDIGFIPDFHMPINLSDNIPISEAYRQVPRLLYDEVKSHINDLLANGWVRQSQSPYSSPMVCVRKKDGSLRLCVDYRKLNAKTIPDRQPILRVQDLLDGLGGQKWFTTLDMSQAYHQGQISEESRKFTAFSTPWSLYEWVRMPYGLTNAPACFQRYMNDCLYHLRDRICIVYLDDILIYGRTFEEHQRNVETVIKVLISKGIKL
jgi:hypothetical protein